MLPQHFLAFAHQGGGLLAPENTLAAFERGAAFHPDALELDIQLSRDGVIVVSHDPTADRVTDGHERIADLTLREIQRLDAGYRFTLDNGRSYPFRGQGLTIPTLEEIFTRFPDLLINIDLKEPVPGKEERLWETIQEANAAGCVIVGSFVCPSLRYFRQITHNTVPTSACPREVLAFIIASHTHTSKHLRLDYRVLQVPEMQGRFRIVSPRSIRVAHRMGVQVHIWTVNNRADMERLLDWGVDGIMTDRPDVLADVLRQTEISGPQ
jgi:glycerophosphoryl diester phosphodiesterase